MNEDIGHALRRARLDRGLPLREVASAVGISTSLLSQVENGKSQPSVRTLFALASTLSVSLDDLVDNGYATDEPAPSQHTVREGSDDAAGIQRSADNPVIEMEHGVRWEQLAGHAENGLQSLHVTYAAKASSSPEGRSMVHHGHEFVYMLSGTLRLKLEFGEHELHAGDSLCFNSMRPHRYYNPTDTPAVGIWLMFDPESADGVAPRPGRGGPHGTSWDTVQNPTPPA